MFTDKINGYVSHKLIIDCRDISGGIQRCKDMNINLLSQKNIYFM